MSGKEVPQSEKGWGKLMLLGQGQGQVRLNGLS